MAIKRVRHVVWVVRSLQRPRECGYFGGFDGIGDVLFVPRDKAFKFGNRESAVYAAQSVFRCRAWLESVIVYLTPGKPEKQSIQRKSLGVGHRVDHQLDRSRGLR